MTATREVVLSSTDSHFRPDDIVAAPDGSLFVADWYDSIVGGHAYNNREQGRIFLLCPTRGNSLQLAKPGPYKNVDDAIAGLDSPNLATQFLARERLLAGGEASVPALKELLSHADSNIRARAMWILDRLDGEARQLVVQQLESADPDFRALAVRILRRHGETHSDAILAMAGDASSDVIREVLITIRASTSDDADACLAKIARQYDGSDRFLLEAINIGATNRRRTLYEMLGGVEGFTIDQFSLLHLLSPAAARRQLQTLLASTRDAEDLRQLLTVAGVIGDPKIGKVVLQFAMSNSVQPQMKRLALERVSAQLDNEWSILREDQTLTAALRKALAEPRLQTFALHMIGERGLWCMDDAVTDLARSMSIGVLARCLAIAVSARLSYSPEKRNSLRHKPEVSPIGPRLTALREATDGRAHSLLNK